MAELLRLRIPRGWVVLENKLYDTDPKADETSSSIINWDEGFVEDVLWIQECQATDNGEYGVSKINHFNIDISWLPDSNMDGKYYATLSWMAIDEMTDIEKFESKDRHQIREKIEFWMTDIKSFESDYRTRISK
jgi:hypothetical protein